MYRPSAAATARPTIVDARTTAPASPIASATILRRVAPSAIRTPISRVRFLTTWLITPNVPTAASTNARPANRVAMSIVNRCVATDARMSTSTGRKREIG